MSYSDYELQLFGFTASQQTLERRHIVEKSVNDALDNLIKKVSVGMSAETVEEVHLQKESVSKSMLLSLADDLKDLEALDRKLFNVPSHVLLESDFQFLQAKEMERVYNREYESVLDEEIEELNRTYRENSVFRCLLEEFIAKFESIKPFIEDQNKNNDELVQFLDKLPDFDEIDKLINETIELSDKN